MSHASNQEPHYLDPRTGARVEVTYTTDAKSDDCAFCQEGRCEQRVESCAAWDCEVTIHDRPRFMN
jgi:hypothetical protein